MRNATLTMRTLLAIAVGLGAWGLTSQAAFAAPIYSDEIMDLSPIDYWRLGEGSGNAQDEATGGSPTGTYDSGVTRQAAGPSSSNGFPGFGSSNDAPDFNGDDGVNVNMGAYAPVTGSSARTIIAWINAANTDQGKDGRGSIVTFGDDTNGGRFRLELVSGEFGVDAGRGWIRSNNALSINEWHMVAAVLPSISNPESDDVQLFIDGQQETDTSTKFTLAINTGSSEDFAIAGRDNKFNFHGLIDEVAVFDKALTAPEISDLWSTATIPEPATLALLGLGGAVMLSGRKRRHA